MSRENANGLKKGRRHVSLVLRSACLAAAVVLALQFAGGKGAAYFPSMSPFLSVMSAVASRVLSLSMLISVPLVLLSLWRGRWFCRFLCPTGLVLEVAGKLHRRARGKVQRIPRLGPWILLISSGAAVAGYSLFLWLDPLALLNSFVVAWVESAPIFLLPAVPFLMIVLLSLLIPNVWCYRLCPLGSTQAMLGEAGCALRDRWDGRKTASVRSKSTPAQSPRRRLFLGVALGGVVGLVLRRASAGHHTALRPPGAASEDRMSSLCARCGNCVRACPEGIIHYDVGETGIAGLLSPVVRIGPGYCSEWCNACNEVCPTGAIKKMDLNSKRQVSLGLARVTKSDCIAWNDQQYCMVCHEYCPYHAIRPVEHEGVNCPEVDPDICRGCGLCQTVCPAPRTAIIVHGQRQKLLAPVPM